MSGNLRRSVCCLKQQLVDIQAQIDALVEVDNQIISLAGNVITLSGGLVPDTTVNLSPFLDNTDDQIISASLTGTDLIISLEDGGTVTVPLASLNTDDQTITLAGSNLSIEDGNTVDLSVFLDNTDDQVITAFSLVGDTLALTIENGNTVTVDLSQYDDNTDDQLLGLVGNTLSIEDGNSVDLSAYLDNTDNQVLSLVGNNLTLTSDDGNDVVDLSAYLDNTDAQILTANLVGTDLVITISNGNTVTVPLASIDTDTDDQTLSLVGNILSIQDGNSVDLSSFINTDNQTLTVFGGAATGTTGISISGGNAISITHPPVNLNVTTATILHERYRGRSANGTTTQHVVDSTMTRTAVGQWQVRFTGGTHPNGESYTPSFSWEEEGNIRDNPKLGIVQGTQNAAGFDVMITADDNGGAADFFVDHPWSWSVESPINVVTAVSVA